MTLRISGKQMKIGDALSERIEFRIEEAISKYFDGGFSGAVTMEKTGKSFECDCTVHLDTGVVLQATGRGHEPNAVFDEAADRIEKRLRRYKRRLKDHHNSNWKTTGEASYVVMEAPEDEEELGADYAPAIVAESSTAVMTLSVAEAVMQLDMTDKPVFVFTNAGNGRTNVVYRRADGNIGWIDPASTA